jgi:hypothetical protein
MPPLANISDSETAAPAGTLAKQAAAAHPASGARRQKRPSVCCITAPGLRKWDDELNLTLCEGRRVIAVA